MPIQGIDKTYRYAILIDIESSLTKAKKERERKMKLGYGGPMAILLVLIVSTSTAFAGGGDEGITILYPKDSSAFTSYYENFGPEETLTVLVLATIPKPADIRNGRIMVMNRSDVHYRITINRGYQFYPIEGEARPLQLWPASHSILVPAGKTIDIEGFHTQNLPGVERTADAVLILQAQEENE